MNTTFLKTSLVFLILIFDFSKECETKYGKYVKRFVRYAKEELKKYQIVSILNTTISNPDLDDIVNCILSEVPGLIVNVSQSKVNEIVELTVFQEPRPTTLFVVVEYLKGNASAMGYLNFLNQLTPKMIRPRCLIISLCADSPCNYEKLLRQMWSEHYLDVTIFQLSKKTISQPFQDREQMKALVHHFNPFTDVYEKLEYSRKIEWFPNKLQNMHGYNFKGGIVNLPPYSTVKYNHKGDPEYSGENFLMFKAMSKVLNFSASIITHVDAGIGVYNLENKSATGMIGKCVNNEINIFITSIMQTRTSKQILTEKTRMIYWEYLCAIVPNFPGREEVLQNTTMYPTLLFLMIVSIFIYVAAHLLTFDTDDWEIFDIVRVLLGMAVPREPTTVAARIFFTCILGLSFCYASNLFGGLTSTNLKITTQFEIKDFKDLDNSGLVPMIVNPNFFKITFKSGDAALSNLGKKYLNNGKGNSTECIRIIKKYKNVTCLQIERSALNVVASSINGSGYSPLKIMKQRFWSAAIVMLLEKGSPYAERLNKVIISFIESGLTRKWSGNYSQHLSKSDRILKKRKEEDFTALGSVHNIRQRLIFITIHGYLLSIVVFLGEIVFKKMQGKCSFRSNSIL